MARAGQPSGLSDQVRCECKPIHYTPASTPVLPRGPSLRSPLGDHVKEACESRDVTRPNPIGASVYVGTSGASRLALRSPAERGGAGTPQGGFAGGLPQRQLHPLPGVPLSWPSPLAVAACCSASRLCSRRTCRRENEPEGHAGASVCRGVGRWGARGGGCGPTKATPGLGGGREGVAA